MTNPNIAKQLASIQKKREALEKKEQALKSKSNEKAMSQILKIAKDAAITPELIAAAMGAKIGNKVSTKVKRGPKPGRKSAMAGVKVPPKFRNPANPEQTWTGRGLMPVWLKEIQATGSIESALIKNAPEQAPQA